MWTFRSNTFALEISIRIPADANTGLTLGVFFQKENQTSAAQFSELCNADCFFPAMGSKWE